ncbi:MAG: hypothetical protein Q8K63_16150 [Acidimicrobiales bacterium]|nr:hypothetical protein [Acidimicrobiales bacterium]
MSFEPTHRVGSIAIPTWPTADRSQSTGPELAAGLEVRVVDRQGDLAKVQCSNDWEAWVENASLELLVTGAASPAGPPPSTASTTPVNAGPRKLIPFLVAGVVIGLLATFVLTRGDDDKKAAGSSTATSKPVAGPNAIEAGALLPTTATIAAAGGGQWDFLRGPCSAKGSTAALTGGEDCVDNDSFEFLCADENLERTSPEGRASALYSQDPSNALVEVNVRVFKTESAAEGALDLVRTAYDGPCTDTEESTSVMSPLAVEVPGDEHIAGHEVDLDTSDAKDHVWVRLGRVLASFEVRDGDDLPDTIYRDLTQSIAANIP